MKTKRESKLIAAAMTVFTALAVLSGSIAVPILCRSFYYAHITPLQMRLRVRLTEEQVRETYNEVMDYCMGKMDTFELSHLTWSAEGASHFADVRNLFLLDLTVAATAIALLVILWAIRRYCNIRPTLIKDHSPMFWAATGLVCTFTVLGFLGTVDFDGFFTAFHTVFFPGKDNWIFDPETDPVINMLPQVFFRNCAILVGALILIGCIILILADRYYRKRHHLIQK